MREFATTPIAYSVHCEGDNPVFGETATHVCVEDELGGPFITLKQPSGEVRLDPKELDVVFKIAKQLMEAQP